MRVQVNHELCNGCSACLEACSVGAIHLVDYRAVIDDALCTGCEACVDACPNGAITAIAIQAPSASILKPPEVESSPVPAWTQTTLPEKAVPARGLATLAGAALAFLGREVAPRLVDILVTALERRFARPATTAITPLSTSPGSLTRKNAGKRRQVRYRGGQIGIGNLKGRR